MREQFIVRRRVGHLMQWAPIALVFPLLLLVGIACTTSSDESQVAQVEAELERAEARIAELEQAVLALTDGGTLSDVGN